MTPPTHREPVSGPTTPKKRFGAETFPSSLRARKVSSVALKALTLKGDSKPRLVFLGHGSMEGRTATLLKMRPSLWKELDGLGVVGANYQIAELALRLLIEELKAQPLGETLAIRALEFEPTEEDFQLLRDTVREVKKVPKKGIGKTNWSESEKNLL